MLTRSRRGNINPNRMPDQRQPNRKLPLDHPGSHQQPQSLLFDNRQAVVLQLRPHLRHFLQNLYDCLIDNNITFANFRNFAHMFLLVFIMLLLVFMQ